MWVSSGSAGEDTTYKFLGYDTMLNATQVLALLRSLFSPLSLYYKKRSVV